MPPQDVCRPVPTGTPTDRIFTLADHPPPPQRTAASRTAGPEDERQSLAVALRSQTGDAANSRIVASGRGALAEQILEIAFERGVKVRSDRDLAEILSAIEVESEIPLSALGAVAEILSYVYRSQAGGAFDGAEAGTPMGEPK